MLRDHRAAWKMAPEEYGAARFGGVMQDGK